MDEISWLVESARQLADHGLARSALRLLDASLRRGRVINNLRAAARRAGQAPGILPRVHVPVTIGDTAVVVPLAADPGNTPPAGCDDDGCESCQIAMDVAAAHLEQGQTLPLKLAVSLPESLCTAGRSLGLAAGLEIARRLGGLPLPGPVIATGELSRAGAVLAVDRVRAKVEAAMDELRGTAGLVLVPSSCAAELDPGGGWVAVSSFAEALGAVWNRRTVPVDPRLLDVERLLELARKEQDHRAAVRLLESRSRENLPAVDRARLLQAIGSRLRHTGDIERAEAIHAEANALLPQILKIAGRGSAEDVEVEILATQVGLLRFEQVEERLRTLLGARLEVLHNRVRCQGMLAQVLSMTGRHEEAVELRQNNLELQTETEAMRGEIPRTLASLAWEAARGGFADVFDETLDRLEAETAPGDDVQQRYNDAAAVRGMVLLGRHTEALKWRGGPTFLPDTISGHPEVSTARFLVRALFETGNDAAAEELARRVVLDQPEPMLCWLSNLVRVEVLMGEAKSGIPDAAALDTLRAELSRICSFASVLSTEARDIRPWLDRVYF